MDNNVNMDNANNLKPLLAKISEFVLPVESRNATQDSPSEWLDKILDEKLQKYSAGVSLGSDDVRWSYVEQGLALLNQLCQCLVRLRGKECQLASAGTRTNQAPPLPADSISIGHQSCISGLVQIILVFGAVPSFIPGVGIPVDKRTKFADVLKDEKRRKDLNIEDYHSRLVRVVSGLTTLLEHDGLANIILSRHFGDLVAGLIQLGYAPLMKPVSQEEIVRMEKPPLFHMTQELFDKLSAEQTQFRMELDNVMDRVYQPVVVKQLLILQSSGARETAGKPVPKSINKIASKPAPRWLQRVCGRLLSSVLTRGNNGLLDVVRGIMDVSSSPDGNDASVQDLKKFQLVAQIIANPPKDLSGTEEDYYRLICPQVLRLLDIKDGSDSKALHLISAACIRSLNERSPQYAQDYLIQPLMEPLLRLTSPSLNLPTDTIITNEDELSECIGKLQFVFEVSSDPSMKFTDCLSSIILVLLALHCQLHHGVSHVKKHVDSLVEKFIKNASGDLPNKALACFAFDENDPLFRRLNQAVDFVNTESGGVQCRVKEDSNQQAHISEFRAGYLVTLLDYDKYKSATTNFFLYLLQELTKSMGEKGGEDQIGSSVSDSAQLLHIETKVEQAVAKIEKQLTIVRLISLFSEDEKLQDALMENPEQKIRFLLSTLHRVAVTCRERLEAKSSMSGLSLEEGTNYGGDPAELQSLTMAVSLLKHHLAQKEQIKPKDWDQLQECEADLQLLATNYQEKSVALLCHRLRECILTRGALDPDEPAAAVDKTGTNEKITEVSADSYESAARDASETEIPVRGHGLIALTRLVEAGDPEAAKHAEEILETFRENLKHRDTYVYLQSVKGMAACSKHNPELVIEELTKQFNNLVEGNYSVDEVAEVHTKLGEALVQVTRVLGQMTPAHKNRLLNPVLNQLSHPDDLIRASALSNLGEICKNLKFSLDGVIHEVLLSLDNVINCDRSLTARRAAVLVIVLLLEGLGQDTLRVLQSSIRDIWRSLTKLRNTETDEVMLHHVAQAITLIDDVVKRFFQPSPKLQKTIYVLDTPPEHF